MKPAIEVKNLSKFYRISHTHTKHNTIKDEIVNLVKRPFNMLTGNKEGFEEFWALKNIDFEVAKGDVIGVVGRNGSGKSTLLKVLSRIVDPTTGEITMRGKVASLLEVGTGFHPELTGRENIYFNGSILGMTKKEMDNKFKEIINFAEIEKFLDTPVKFYSSGMYVRLAFAVAAHLEPDILIVDEVLAVGDTAFQKKCLDKMESVAKEGRTILFVSHNMLTVQSLCNKGILLNNGKIESMGPIDEVLRDYNEAVSTPATLETSRQPQATEGVRILGVRLAGSTKSINSDAPLHAELTFSTQVPLPNCFINLNIDDPQGKHVIHARTDFHGENPSFEPGTHRVKIKIPRLSLHSGSYSLWFRIYCDQSYHSILTDSNQVILHVKGPAAVGPIDLPVDWTWGEVK